MLVPNCCELDELPFLKLMKFAWTAQSEHDEAQRSKLRLLENIRSFSYQFEDILAKVFLYETKVKKDTSTEAENQSQGSHHSIYEELIVTTQKEIVSLEKFFYILNDLLDQEHFSQTVAKINKFVKDCKKFIRDVLRSKFEIDFGNKQFLTFGVYMKKQNQNSLDFSKQHSKNVWEGSKQANRFYIKCSVTNFSFEPFKDLVEAKCKKPEPFVIQSEKITKKLFEIYLQLASVPLSIKTSQIKKYVSVFDTVCHMIDEEYLKLQVFKNYPLLRSKFFIPIKFNDSMTGQRLEGPIFSNSDLDCMFSHFMGYNADTIHILDGNHCEQCRSYFEGVQQNPLLSNLRDNLFNPYKADVLFCPEFNRFKLIMKVPSSGSQNDQEEKMSFRTQIKYLNFLHLRANLKKLTTKKRNKFNDGLKFEKFSLSFQMWGRRLLVMDPVRGKDCSHYEFTDLRLFYLNKASQTTFKCPICNNLTPDNDIIYLKEVQILIKYVKFKCSKLKQLTIAGECFINHEQRKVFLEYKQKNKTNGNIENEIQEIKGFYDTLVDPYVSFNEYSLRIPDKYQKRLRQRYLFGAEQKNEDEESDDEFEEGDLQFGEMREYKQVAKGNPS